MNVAMRRGAARTTGVLAVAVLAGALGGTPALADPAGLVVVTRPGYGLVEADLDPELRREFINRRVINAAECTNFNAGMILSLELTTLPISSTAIRTMLRKGETTELFLQQDVASFIHTHKLYQ